jgi:hypothetical protein
MTSLAFLDNDFSVSETGYFNDKGERGKDKGKRRQGTF